MFCNLNLKVKVTTGFKVIREQIKLIHSDRAIAHSFSSPCYTGSNGPSRELTETEMEIYGF